MTQHETTSTAGGLLLEAIDEALANNPALSELQMDDVRRLKREIVRHSEEGRKERAERAAELCLRLIRQGEAVKE